MIFHKNCAFLKGLEYITARAKSVRISYADFNGTKSTKTYYNLLQQFYEGEVGDQKYPEPFGPEELDLEIAALGSREYGMTSS